MTRTSNPSSNNTLKFLYSYGGKILPRRTDGKLRYVGGHTRVLAVDRSISFAELMVRFGELCGSSMSLKCKLPSEDLDLLVSVTCDEDLANVIDEYDRYALSTRKEDLKVRAVLLPLKSLKNISPPTSTGSSVDFSATASPPLAPATPCQRGARNYSPAVVFPGDILKEAGKFRCCPRCEHGSPRDLHLVCHWNRCQ
ncbi:uncharacterized protein LOC127793977 [Diospyros lotus]|uniref:uncharacterized protein LOC127793977 n=1 Tax=Diospyros lotus TaxID=55363 RepID=UPI00225BFD4A|nr:uncharacterized protein LOC127793977 [Diospyros lotus]